MPTIQITLPINLSFVIGSFLMSAITNSEHSIIGWINDALARLRPWQKYDSHKYKRKEQRHG